MNREHVLEVADAIENATLAKDYNIGFNMGYYIWFKHRGFDKTKYDCSTVACIAGWTAIISDLKNNEEIDIHKECDYYEKTAQEYLGLNSKDSYELFFPEVFDEKFSSYLNILPEHAVKVLRNLAETGIVDWSIISENKENRNVRN